jgi:hypothetical protein
MQAQHSRTIHETTKDNGMTDSVDYLADPKELRRAYHREWSRKNYADPEKRARRRAKEIGYERKSNYKITPDLYKEMLVAQGGVCLICKQPCSTGKALAIDHNHKCCPVARKSSRKSSGRKTCGKCNRGLLCCKCNNGLGYFQDSPVLLFAGIEYIMRYAAQGEING